MEFIPFHWSHISLQNNYNGDITEFIGDYHEKLVLAVKKFQKKYAKTRKFLYNINTKSWESVATNENKSRKNGSVINTRFNDYFFTTIKHLYQSKIDERRSAKNHPGVFCMICKKKIGTIDNKHLRRHEITLEEYTKRYPYAPLSKTIYSMNSENNEGLPYEQIHAVKQFAPGQEIEDLDFIKSIFPNKKDYLLTMMRLRGASMIEICKTLKMTKEEVKATLMKRRKNDALVRYAKTAIFGTGNVSYCKI